jgi:hypothetical protein
MICNLNQNQRTMLNLNRNICLNFSVIFMNGIEYHGALHLWLCFSDISATNIPQLCCAEYIKNLCK